MYFYPPDKFELTFALQTGFNYIPLYEGLFSGSWHINQYFHVFTGKLVNFFFLIKL